MVFLSICPRDKRYLEYAVKDIPLRVVLDDGAEISPDVNVKVTDLNKGYKHFKIDSGKGNEMTFTVMIHRKDRITGRTTTNIGGGGKDAKNAVNLTNKAGKVIHGSGDIWGSDSEGNLVIVDSYDVFSPAINTSAPKMINVYENLSVYTMLNYFYRHGVPLILKSDSLIIPSDSVWLITKNPSRKYERGGWFYWELTFTRYVPVKYAAFTKVNKGVQRALKKAKSKKKAKVSAKTKLRKQLGKCNRNVLVYSKKKKTVACVKTLQQYLNKDLGTKLVIDGWFGKETTKAVKKYQTKYSKSFGLKPTGKINQLTYNVMIGKGKLVTKTNVNKKNKGQIGKTITIKSNTKGILK